MSEMTQTEILAKMQTVFDDVFLDDVKVTPELSANDVEEWDSLLQISLVLGVEKAFGVRFRVGEVESTKNLGEFANLIQRRMVETAKA
jgi:acyl carrier protein